MKKITIFTFVAIFAMALIGCSSTGTNNANVKVANANVNSNTAVVVNSNQAPITNTSTTTTTNSNSWNANITRDEYDKNQADYANRAKSAGGTIGSGANDGWLWTKTKAALATTNELRDSTINVDVDNAVVTLKGTVATKAEADKAIATAKAIEGVKDVKSVLKVQPNDSLTNQVTGSNTSTTNTRTNTNK